MPLIGNELKPLAKNILIPLGLTVAASARDATIHKKMFMIMKKNNKIIKIFSIFKKMKTLSYVISSEYRKSRIKN